MSRRPLDMARSFANWTPHTTNAAETEAPITINVGLMLSDTFVPGWRISARGPRAHDEMCPSLASHLFTISAILAPSRARTASYGSLGRVFS